MLSKIYFATAIPFLIALIAGFTLDRYEMLAAIGIGTALTLGWAHMSVVTPLNHILGAIKSVAGGDMAKALRLFKDNELEIERLRKEHGEQRQIYAERQADSLRQMADDFENSINAKVTQVETAARGIDATAHDMAKRTENTGGRSLKVGEAANMTTDRSAVVSAATDELSSSVKEIAQQAEQSSAIAQKAVDDINLTSSQMDNLAEAVREIGVEVFGAEPPPVGRPLVPLPRSASNSSSGARRAAFTRRSKPISRWTRGSILRRTSSSVCRRIWK